MLTDWASIGTEKKKEPKLSCVIVSRQLPPCPSLLQSSKSSILSWFSILFPSFFLWRKYNLCLVSNLGENICFLSYCSSLATSSPSSGLWVLTIITDLQELSEFHPLLLAMKVIASGIGYLLRFLREALMNSQCGSRTAVSASSGSLSEMQFAGHAWI